MKFYAATIILAVVSSSLADVQPQSQPNLQPAMASDNVASYVQGPNYNPQPYQYTEPNYGPQPYENNNYMVPYPVQEEHPDSSLTFLSTIVPYTKGRSHSTVRPELIIIKILLKLISLFWNTDIGRRLVLRLLARLGLFVLGGSIMLVIGGLFTTAVCALTPICTITFMGYGLNKETMRSYMTPDRLNAASAFVQDAIDKYQKLQNIS